MDSVCERVCAVSGCPGRDSINIRQYRIPNSDKEAWCTNINFKISQVRSTTRVCSRHFEKSCIGHKKLKVGARPTLHLGHEGFVHPIMVKDKPNNPRVCSIVGCNSTTPPTTLYSFPENKEQLNQWLLICALKENTIMNKHKYICGKHFDPSMITAKGYLKRNAVPKMDIQNWLDNNASIDKSIALTEPEMHNVMKNAYELLSGVKGTTTRICCIVDCKITSPPDILISFPREKERLNKCLSLCAIKHHMIAHSSKYICRQHFDALMLDIKQSKKSNVAMGIENKQQKYKAIKDLNVAPEDEVLNAIENPLNLELDNFSDVDINEFESENELEADSSECLECTNICHSCVKIGKVYENERERCHELEKQLKVEQAEMETLRMQNAQLLAQLEAKNLVSI